MSYKNCWQLRLRLGVQTPVHTTKSTTPRPGLFKKCTYATHPQKDKPKLPKFETFVKTPKKDPIKEKKAPTEFTPMSEIPISPSFFAEDSDARAKEADAMQRYTAEDCRRKFSKPQRNIQMLTREFIHDSLYHPQYGYFSKHALIFSPDQAYDFNSIRDGAELLSIVGEQYHEIEQELDDVSNIPRQLWHTPTELLKPWYGRSIARYIVQEYRAKWTNQESTGTHAPLIMYEVGAGNGTLMMNIMDYLCENEPDLYVNCQYKIIEISGKLARQQQKQWQQKHRNVDIINASIFEWNKVVDERCFFIAMEVIDNFAHDVVRYNTVTGEPYQGFAALRRDGEFEEWLEPVNDPVITRYLEAREAVGYVSPCLRHPWLRQLRSKLPFAPNLTLPEYLPTRTFEFCEILHKYFPKHHLILSDFHRLPDTIPGYDAPVVQTRFRGSMVPCSTYLVQPGWFDIFFPTNFELLGDIYWLVKQQQYKSNDNTDNNSSMKKPRILGQRDFAQQHAELKRTRTRSGENPILDFYENNTFLLS
ncbi:hypothetical protein H4219_005749 [Mycoemilia scoparia]|uniref:Protein arginine methyltransferase NDUFAF7 n=1 Tax=Mycoemilia scoparia TaxID=417184 RepID=A0A9W7ZMU2_9FUNG|nr:hypothetical protein H4219_005749 [Mycoemilia scoparia]